MDSEKSIDKNRIDLSIDKSIKIGKSFDSSGCLKFRLGNLYLYFSWYFPARTECNYKAEPFFYYVQNEEF